MNRFFVTALSAVVYVCAAAAQKPASGLAFDVSKGVAGSVTVADGRLVHYTAYTKLFYVANVEDSTYQYLNIFVPDGATQRTPIFMRNYVGGYMASEPRGIDPGDASGRALAEGYVVAIPGARGRNSTVKGRRGRTVYTGRAPKALLDLKAAVRYLRLFDSAMPGDAERIITDGTSAGGAMSALLGATGNHPDYEPMLKAMGAADTRDDIYAAVCYCPIIDLEHADMAYEWLYRCTNGKSRPLTDEQERVSDELAAMYPAYLDSLCLKKADGTPLNSSNMLDYVRQLIMASAQEAKDAGAEIADTLGFTFSASGMFRAPVNGGVRPAGGPDAPGRHGRGHGPQPGGRGGKGEYITGLDMDKYLAYVVSTIALKTPPAFDSKDVAGGRASGENEEFGNDSGSSVNFTAYSLRRATGNAKAELPEETGRNVRMLNPMRYIADPQSTVAPHWYIRHGARDRDTAFPVPVALAVKLQNTGRDVDFKLPWNRPHSGDYALGELFGWTAAVAPAAE